MKCFALTGGIASGKSTLAELLKKAGVPVIDADVLARQVVAPGSDGLLQIKATFGSDYVQADGALDRAKMAALVFAQPEAKKNLEAIIHPRIKKALAEALQALDNQGVEYAVYEAPLIFELGIHPNFAATLLVTTPEDERLKRIIARDNLSVDQALARVRAQMSDPEKRALADHCIDNTGSVEDAAQALKKVWHTLTGQTLNI